MNKPKLGNSPQRTYISLFSSAGVGCYGFELNGFECIATNELLNTRLAVQKANNKCKYESGYICGDITRQEIQDRLFAEIDMWHRKENLRQVDVVFATPPCQGMSTVNYKKNDHEQIRNSLVVQAIKIIKKIHPKIFVFENVRAFLKSICTDISGADMPIRDSIITNLSEEYNIYSKVINFKDYGVPSSRPRTIVIGTSKNLTNISPLNLFPTRKPEQTLRSVIGNFPSLAFGQKDAHDPLHFARPFPEHEIEWISDLKEGQSAFEKPDGQKPYKIDAHGRKVILKGAYMGNKYRRLFWDKPCSCIATRNDVLSSQDTIHPCDNRVLSIRELMRLMTIPDSFRWTAHDDLLTVENSDAYLKKHEMNIRHCIGEAVPTKIISDIAIKIRILLAYVDYISQKNVEMDCCIRQSETNYYIAVSEATAGIRITESSIFNNLMSYDPNPECVKIAIDDAGLFLRYLPQLSGYLSHKDKVRICTVTFSQEQKDEISRLVSLIPIGSNIELVYQDEPCRSFDFVIDDDGFFPKKHQQLTLF